MDIQAEVERHIAKARANGSTQANAERAGLLWLSMLLHRLRSRLALKQANEIAARLPVLEGKAVTAADRLAVLDIEIGLIGLLLEAATQDVLDPRGKAADFEGKAVAGWSRERRQAFIDIIKAGGGGTADGRGFRDDPLAATDAAFARAESIVRGEAEPTAAERVALERFNRTVVLGAGP